MEKIEKFKAFVKTKPYLAYKVHANVTSWQKLYEIYDMYGENHEIFSLGEKTSTNDQKTNETSKNEKGKDDSKNKEKEKEKSSPGVGESVTSILKSFQNIDLDKLNDNVSSLKKLLAIFAPLKASSSTKEQKTYKRFED